MRRKGITLVELLVVMVIVALSAGGIFFAYRSLVRETITQSLFAKNEQDVEVLLTSLRKDLQGIGFGVPVNRLNLRYCLRWACRFCPFQLCCGYCL